MSKAHVNLVPFKIDRGAVPLLRVDGLSIEFRTRSGTVQALDRIGFTLGRGETMALVGESGSGKSVTAYAVMGINDPAARVTGDRKSTRLNSSHQIISYAVFCFKKKKVSIPVAV